MGKSCYRSMQCNTKYLFIYEFIFSHFKIFVHKVIFMSKPSAQLFESSPYFYKVKFFLIWCSNWALVFSKIAGQPALCLVYSEMIVHIKHASHQSLMNSEALSSCDGYLAGSVSQLFFRDKAVLTRGECFCLFWHWIVHMLSESEQTQLNNGFTLYKCVCLVAEGQVRGGMLILLYAWFSSMFVFCKFL